MPRRKVEDDLWPDSQYGEVVGPSGARCFRAERAGQILGLGGRAVREAVQREDIREDSSRGPNKEVYVLADSVEAVARRLGRWPPPAVAPTDHDAWEELFASQGRDLEVARCRIRDLERELASMRQDARDLAIAHERLARMVARRYNDGQ